MLFVRLDLECDGLTPLFVLGEIAFKKGALKSFSSHSCAEPQTKSGVKPPHFKE
jgi:hypothetical protein